MLLKTAEPQGRYLLEHKLQYYISYDRSEATKHGGTEQHSLL